MLTKQKILQLTLVLLKAGDFQLLQDGSVLHGESCNEEDKEKIKKIAQRIADFYQNYDYFLSSEFSKEVEGKSQAFRDKKIQLESSPVKKQKHKEAFISCIRELQTSDEIYNLLPLSEHEKIKELYGWLDSLSLE